jgi:hypothetical protein
MRKTPARGRAGKVAQEFRRLQFSPVDGIDEPGLVDAGEVQHPGLK